MLSALNLASITVALWLTAERTSSSPVATSSLWPVQFTGQEERGEPGAEGAKVIMPGKTVPYKCCLPDSNISVKKDFDTDVRFI